MGKQYFWLCTKEGNLRAGRATGCLHGWSSASYSTHRILVGKPIQRWPRSTLHCLFEGVRRTQVRKNSWWIILPLPKSEKNIKVLHTIWQHEAPQRFQASPAGCESFGFKALHPWHLAGYSFSLLPCPNDYSIIHTRWERSWWERMRMSSFKTVNNLMEGQSPGM